MESSPVLRLGIPAGELTQSIFLGFPGLFPRLGDLVQDDGVCHACQVLKNVAYHEGAKGVTRRAPEAGNVEGHNWKDSSQERQENYTKNKRKYYVQNLFPKVYLRWEILFFIFAFALPNVYYKH